MITDEQRSSWESDGFFIVPGFADGDVLHAMEERVVHLARTARRGGDVAGAMPLAESKLEADAENAEDGLSKMFRVHRNEPVFRAFASDASVLDRVAALIGPELDCFLSQFIFKMPGALGQPWHQDGFYFPFDRGPQVGLWLAITESVMENGPLWVLPGSHREAVHEVVPDRREHASLGYVEIVDHDMRDAVPVLLKPGDALFFHSHLMHKSTDNESKRKRAAMVYHFAEGGTVDQSQERWGFVPGNVDWMPIRRRIDTEIEIDAPVDVVRRLLTDGERYSEWNPYLVRVDGRLHDGADVVALGRNEDGSEMSMDVHVVSVGASEMRWEGGLPDRSLFRGDHRFAWEPLPSGRTRLRHFEVFTGSLVGDVLGSQRPVIERNFTRMNEALRDACVGSGG